MTADANELLTAARGGDPAAAGVLLERYRNYLRLLARIEIGRRLQGKVDASDVVQEAFLDAHRYLPAFRGQGEAELTRWLREILAGTLANQVRRYFGTQARDVRLEQAIRDDVGRSSVMLGHVPVDPHSSPSERAAEGEQSLLVAEAMARLPDDYQTVLVLRHLEGLSFPEIAARVGKTVDSVEKLWLRGLTKLKQSFKGTV